MSTMDTLAEGGGRRQFYLAIDGIPVRYWSGWTPPSGTIAVPDTAAAIFYAERTAITRIGETSASYDLAGGVAEHSPMTVEIACVDADDPWDALNVFGRCGAKSATFATQVVETIPSSAAGLTFDIEDDATGLTFPCLVYVGDETMKATAAAAAPNTITVTRAAGGTLPQRHVYDPDLGDAPLLTSEPVSFRGRTATVYCFDAPGVGQDLDTTPTPIEIFRGFLAAEAVVDDESLQVTLTLQPLTARLDTPIGVVGEIETGLLHGWHYFSDGRAQTLAHVQLISPYDQQPRYQVGANPIAAGAGFYALRAGDANLHSSSFHTPTGVSPALPHGHPRSGRVYDLVNRVPMSVTGYSGGTGFTVDTAFPTEGVDETQWLYDCPVAELHLVDVVQSGGATLAPWPGVAIEAINSQAGWMPGQGNLSPAWHGDDGQWVDVQLVLHAGHPHLACQSNVARDIGVAVWGHPRALGPGLRDQGGVPLAMIRAARWWGARRAAPADDWAYDVRAPSPGAHLWYGLSFSNPVNGAVENHVRVTQVPTVDRDRGRAEVPIVGAALGWYQNLERYITVRDDIAIGTDGTRIRIEYTDIYTGERRAYTTTVTASTAVTDADGNTVGYRLTIGQNGREWDVPSFGDWIGIPGPDGDLVSVEPVRITPVVEFTAEDTPGEIVLKLLTSVAGTGANGPYDVLPWGCGIDEADIDTASILGFPYPPQLSAWTFRFPNGSNAAKVLDPMLKLFGAVLAMRTSEGGACRLTMFPLAMETAAEVRGTLDSSAWVEGFQAWGTDDQVRNVFRFKFNYGDDLKPKDEIELRNQRSIRANSGERGEGTFELRGLRTVTRNRFEYESLFRDVWARWSALLGDARRTWRGRLHSGAALRASLGACYRVTSPWLKAYAVGLGVTGAIGRVRRLKIDWWGEGAEVELVHYGINGAGWNAALNVTAVPAATTLTVSGNAYSDLEDPNTGAAQEDLDGFAVGDVVLAVPKGNEDASTQVTITRLNKATNQIGVTPAHGIVAGVLGYVIPSTYDVASALHQALGYLADANSTLGADADPAKDFV